jgi:iron(III) transport system ATP-binding protein
VALRVGVTLPFVTPAGEPVSIEIDEVSVAYDGPPVLRGVSLMVEPGELVALLGPSGCGKTTLLRAIAGLEEVDAGSIVLGGQVVSSTGTHLAPERRRVGMVFQDWALFPHLSVARNVAYGLPRSERSGSRVTEVLEMVGLSGLGDRSPQTLSGGQQQRVALARALAPAPTVLLLDEPFSNLDATLRVQIRTEVHRLLSELDVTAVFVTHDQDEAFVLGHRVAVMRGGELEQWGTPAEVYARPATPWVAGFVGEANLLDGVVDRDRAATAIGAVPLLEAPSDERVSVLVRPEELALAAGEVGVVELVEYYGHDTTYDVRLGDGQRVRVRRPSTPQFERGDPVEVRYRGAGAWAYRAATFGDVRQA